MKSRFRILVAFMLLVFIVPALQASGKEENPAVPPITLKNDTVLSGERLKGANYTVAPDVINDGLFNTYHLYTAYGGFYVESTAALMERINELNALRAMEALEQSGVFKDSLVAGVKLPVQGAVELVKSTVETLS